MKFRIVIVVAVLIAASASCSSGKRNRKPDPEIVVMKKPLPVPGFARADFAKSRNFQRGIGDLKRVSIQYQLSKESPSESEMRSSDWHREIEKALIRMGFEVIDVKEKDFLFAEEEDEDTSDAAVLIDRVVLKKITRKYQIDLNASPDGKAVYPYAYYLAEISGKMVSRNSDIIWSCSIAATSFDLFQHKDEKPNILLRGVREYRFSDKLKGWIQDKWSFVIKDNFSGPYANPVLEEFHKRELIRFSIEKFFGAIAR